MNSASVGIALPISCNGFSLKRQDVIQRGKNSFKVLKLVLIRVCLTCIFFYVGVPCRFLYQVPMVWGSAYVFSGFPYL